MERRMTRPILALATLVIALFAASPVRADYAIIRWSWGDCRVWDNSGLWPVPLGVGWTLLATDLPTYGTASVLLEDLYRQGICR
jgi:hypothetical protein